MGQKTEIRGDILYGWSLTCISVFCETNDCSSKFRCKHSTNKILCLLPNLLGQSLAGFFDHNFKGPML